MPFNNIRNNIRNNIEKMNICIVGLGLMGASLAMALHGFKSARILGLNRGESAVKSAIQDKVIDEGFSWISHESEAIECLNKSDLTIICLYADATIDFLQKYGKFFKSGSVVSDVVGVKESIIAIARKNLPDDVEFIGAHPMAGRECSGYESALRSLYEGCNYVITPDKQNTENAVNLVSEMARYVGASKVTLASSSEHDDMIAYTSQMAHVLASAITQNSKLFASQGFEGNSFGDLTRVARGISGEMWSELFVLNKRSLCEVLDELESEINSMRKMIGESNKEDIRKKLNDTAVKKEEWENNRLKRIHEKEYTRFRYMNIDKTIVPVNASNGNYDIVVGKNILCDVGSYIKNMNYSHAVIICDDNIKRLYLDELLGFLSASDIKTNSIIFQHGETNKNNKTLMQIYSELYKSEASRKSVILAFGGGVVGDIAGFAAASYLRGVDFVQIPTTLLAQVDSSVGGKVAIDLPEGKNLVGAFYQPKKVIIDVDLLKTLDERQFSAGMGEVIKHACIFDKSMFDILPKDNADSESLVKLVARNCEIKAQVVERDPFDKGERMLLNFGHTFGHAIEKTEGYGKILHGEAISLGMLLAVKWGIELGITPSFIYDILEEALKKYGLPTTYKSDNLDELFSAMCGDKKVEDERINIIVLEDLGKAKYVSMTKNEFCELFTKVGVNL